MHVFVRLMSFFTYSRYSWELHWDSYVINGITVRFDWDLNNFLLKRILFLLIILGGPSVRIYFRLSNVVELKSLFFLSFSYFSFFFLLSCFRLGFIVPFSTGNLYLSTFSWKKTRVWKLRILEFLFQNTGHYFKKFLLLFPLCPLLPCLFIVGFSLKRWV